MKGLLIKDAALMLNNKKFLGLIFIIATFLLVTQKEEGIAFAIAYVMVLCQELVLNTFSTDEFDSSVTFLMTLPIDRGIYAAEKYVFSFGCGIVGWALITLACIAAWPSMALETLCIAGIVFAVLTVFQSIVLPIQIKFGGERGRVVLLGIIIVGAAAIGFMQEFFAIGDHAAKVIDRLTEAGPAALVLGGAFLCVLCFGISLAVSRGMMAKKEF